MSATAEAGEPVELLDRAVGSGDVDEALRLVEDLLDAGAEALDVVELIATVQRRVGQRWQDAEWSVAQEHAATAVTASALESVRRRARSVAPDRGRVLLACAEHEWHAMPAMLVAAALRTRGWQVTLLGASTPTARLSRYLQDVGPDLTAVSCSVASGLPDSRAFVEASTTSGIPVLAGGSAFGPDARRALALGATAWAADARSAVDVVDTLPLVVPAAAPLSPEVTAELGALQAAHRAIVHAVATRWVPDLGADPGEAGALRDVVDQAVHAVVGTLLTGDARLLHETTAWVSSVARPRSGRREAAVALGGLLQGELRGYPLASGLLAEHWSEPER